MAIAGSKSTCSILSRCDFFIYTTLSRSMLWCLLVPIILLFNCVGFPFFYILLFNLFVLLYVYIALIMSGGHVLYCVEGVLFNLFLMHLHEFPLIHNILKVNLGYYEKRLYKFNCVNDYISARLFLETSFWKGFAIYGPIISLGLLYLLFIIISIIFWHLMSIKLSCY